MTNNSAASGRIRALDAEIRLPIDGEAAAGIAERPEETRRFILEIAQDVFGTTLDARVELGRSYVETQAFVQFLSVDAAPSAANREILLTQTQALGERLSHDLAIRFAMIASGVRPSVTIDPDRGFLNAHAPGGVVSGYRAPPNRDARSAHAASEAPARGSPPFWAPAALGAAVIAAVFLAWQAKELPGLRARNAALQVEVNQLSYDLQIARTARTFETQECTNSITQHRVMIADLAQRCSPRTPNPTPPAGPRPYVEPPKPYPETPNPFEPQP
jgi:hypothetical protein